MKLDFRNGVRRVASLLSIAVISGILFLNVQAATLSPELQSQIAGISDDGSVGVVIVSFDTSSGLNESHINVLRGIGVDSGVTFQNLGMVGAVLNAGQVRALASNTSVRSIWTNDELSYYMNQARVVTGTDKIRTDSAMTLRNGGMPVSGSDRGDLGRSAV